jgi:heterotetrameric sarcosine oxidase gamma subunit
MQHPLKTLLSTHQPPEHAAFKLQALLPLSVCEIECFNDAEAPLVTALRRVLGLVYPQPWQAFVAGTRAVLRPDSRPMVLALTEGESEGALYRRLVSVLPPDVGTVFDVSHGLCGMRFEGYTSAHALSSGSQENLENFTVGEVRSVRFDHVAVVLHRREFDRWDLYAPRAQADSFCRWLVRLCRTEGVRLVA